MMFLLFVVAIGFSFPSHSRPFVFIADKSGYAWWSAKPIARPMSQNVDGVSIAAMNEYRASNETLPDKICFADPLEVDSIVGLDRATQESIDRSIAAHKGNPFLRSSTTPDGKPFRVRAAVYQTCEGALGGAVLVIGENRKLEHATFRDDNVLTFLWPTDRPALVGASSCFECGDWSSLYYDVTRKRFYWEYEGD